MIPLFHLMNASALVYPPMQRILLMPSQLGRIRYHGTHLGRKFKFVMRNVGAYAGAPLASFRHIPPNAQPSTAIPQICFLLIPPMFVETFLHLASTYSL